MIKQLLAIKDQKAGYYMDPQSYRSIGEAERQFQHLANDPKTIMNQSPEDFVLFHIGEFDTSTGVVHHNAIPKAIMRADAVKKPTP